MLNPLRNRQHLSVRVKLLAGFPALFLLLPLAAIHLPAQNISAQNISGRFMGMVYDPSGATVPDATITVAKSDLSKIEITRSGADGAFNFAALAPGQYELKVMKPGFREYKLSQINVKSGQVFAQDVNLMPEVVRVVLKVAAEGQARGQSDTTAEKAARARVGGDIREPTLLNKVEPVYPPAARAAGIEGTVLLNATIGKKGSLLALRVMNSEVDPELARAALGAVSQWQYSPVLLNGDPIEVETTITVNFRLW